MQKNILILLLSVFLIGTIEAQEVNQEELANQFGLALLDGIRTNNQDILSSIYPSVKDVRGFIDSNFIESIPEDEWNDLKEEIANDLEYYLGSIVQIREESRQHNFNWDIAKLKDVTFQVETETDEDGQMKMDFYSLEILISDGENTLNLFIYDAIFLNNGIKLIEIDSWSFDLEED